MKYINLLIVLLLQMQVIAQLHCKTKVDQGKQLQSCFHKNGTVSTLEEWDKEKRNGNIKAYDARGQELFVYYLRSFAGHASAEIEYHKNGQVSRVNYSSAPDGGIQFFRARRSYDENGKLTEHWEEEYPPKPLTEPLHRVPLPEKIKPADTVTNSCAVPYTSLFMATNVSGKTVELELEPKANLWLNRNYKRFKLKSGQKIILDSVLFAEKYFAPETLYKIHILSPKKGKSLNIVHAVPHLYTQRQVYMMYIIRE